LLKTIMIAQPTHQAREQGEAEHSPMAVMELNHF
jgi:hypothetical protein